MCLHLLYLNFFSYLINFFFLFNKLSYHSNANVGVHDLLSPFPFCKAHTCWVKVTSNSQCHRTLCVFDTIAVLCMFGPRKIVSSPVGPVPDSFLI